MKPTLLLMAFLMVTAGLFSGCSDSGSTDAEARERVSALSEKLTPEEEALIASVEAEGRSEADLSPVETP
jgi:hypothetical protein